MKVVKRSAAEIVATRLGWDIADVSEHRYQPKAGEYPIFAFSFGYLCAPPTGKMPPQPDRFNWVDDGVFLGRKVYKASTGVE
mgnify:CR=1 FL=1